MAYTAHADTVQRAADHMALARLLFPATKSFLNITFPRKHLLWLPLRVLVDHPWEGR